MAFKLGNLISNPPKLVQDLESKIKAAQQLGSGNIASQVINPNLVSNITSNIPGGKGGMAADLINRGIAGVSNQDLVSGAKQGLDFVQNIGVPQIDVSTGLPKMPSTGGDMSILDPVLRGAGNLGTSIKEGVKGLFSSDPSQGPGLGDRISTGLGEAKDKIGNVLEGGVKSVGGGLAAAQQFAAENKNLLNLGVQGVAGYAGYQAGKQARQQQADLLQQQLAETQGVGSKFQGIDYDPQRYAEQQQFLRDRIAGGGYTAEEKQMQQQGDVRGARASAAARLAGVEQMARMTGATGSGAALAASLAGGQATGNIQAETEAARQASAQQKKELAIGQQAQILRQKTAEEADLAKSQAEQQLLRQAQIGEYRKTQGQNIIDQAEQEGNFYKSLANSGSNVITGLESSTEKAKREVAQKQSDLKSQAEVAAINAEANYKNALAAKADPDKLAQLKKDMEEAATKKMDVTSSQVPQFEADFEKMKQQQQPQQYMSGGPKQIQNPLDQMQKNVSQGLNMSQQNMSVGKPAKALDGFNKQNIPIQKPAVPVQTPVPKPAPTPTAVQKPVVPPKPMMQPNPTATPAPKPVPTAINQTKKPLGR